MQYLTEIKLKLNLLCEFYETENYPQKSIKNTKINPDTFYEAA